VKNVTLGEVFEKSDNVKWKGLAYGQVDQALRKLDLKTVADEEKTRMTISSGTNGMLCSAKRQQINQTLPCVSC